MWHPPAGVRLRYRRFRPKKRASPKASPQVGEGCLKGTLLLALVTLTRNRILQRDVRIAFASRRHTAASGRALSRSLGKCLEVAVTLVRFCKCFTGARRRQLLALLRHQSNRSLSGYACIGRELLNFGCDDCKTTPSLTCSRGFYGRIKCQELGLGGNFADG